MAPTATVSQMPWRGDTGTAAEDTPYGRVFRWWHRGHYNVGDGGSLSTNVMHLSNDMSIVFVMNSQASAGVNYGAEITDAFFETIRS